MSIILLNSLPNNSLDGDDPPDLSSNTHTITPSNQVCHHDDFKLNFQFQSNVDVCQQGKEIMKVKLENIR